LVDPERAAARLRRLRDAIELLDEVREEGKKAYLADPSRRAATERWLGLAVQICVDLGTQTALEQRGAAPSNYADVFTTLGKAGLIESDLANRLAEAAKQRNLLAHLYLEIDDEKVFESLSNLDDLRRFAAFVGEQLD
jgi:uncharacterized protein YutE (UPF0331/DUF86 family)